MLVVFFPHWLMSDSEHEFNTSEQCKSSSNISITCRALYLVFVGT